LHASIHRQPAFYDRPSSARSRSVKSLNLRGNRLPL
jgi:hypothetical protein